MLINDYDCGRHMIIMTPTSANGNVTETLLINVQDKPKRILVTTSSPVKL